MTDIDKKCAYVVVIDITEVSLEQILLREVSSASCTMTYIPLPSLSHLLKHTLQCFSVRNRSTMSPQVLLYTYIRM